MILSTINQLYRLGTWPYSSTFSRFFDVRQFHEFFSLAFQLSDLTDFLEIQSEKMLTHDQKLLMAQMIFNEREVLFGEFGPGLTKVEKQEKWMEILVKLNSIGANVNDYKTLRDNEWSNMRRATEKKLATLKENESKSAETKVQCRPLSTLDDIVLDILGKGRGTTTQKTIATVEEMATMPMSALIKYDEDEEEDDDTETGMETMEDPISNTANTIPLPKNRKRKRNFAAHYPLTANYELMELRKKKLQLECAKLELELEKMPLECAKLELEIQKLQRDLLSSNNQNNHETTDIPQ